jgi:sulfide:quinone oxidoreductase
LAAQQADAVAESIAADAGAPVDPSPFRPVLRGQLLIGHARRFLEAPVHGGSGDVSHFERVALWWPPEKVAARHLAAYLELLGEAPPPPDSKETIGVHAGVELAS